MIAVCLLFAVGSATSSGDGCDGKLPTTSKVIPCSLSWADESLLLPHEAIRLLNVELATTLESRGFNPSKNAWQAPAFMQWYKTFYEEVIEHHHTFEEHIYFPWLKKKLGDKMPVLKDSTHYDVRQALEQTEDAAREMMQLTDEDNVDKLRVSVLSMITVVKIHLAEVEKLFAQLLSKHISSAEETEKFQEIMEERGLYDNKVYLPVVLESLRRWGGAEVEQRFKAKLSPVLRTMLDHAWMPHMELNNWRVIRALRYSKQSSNSFGSGAFSIALEHAEILLGLVGCVVLGLVLFQLLTLKNGRAAPRAKGKTKKKQ